MLCRIWAFLVFVIGYTTSAAMDADSVIPVRADDRDMAAAINAARQSVGQFIDAFAHPKPSQRAFLIKIAFSKGSAVEHLWIADLDFHGQTPTGTVADTPATVNLKFMERVQIDISKLSDWMYVDNNKLVGGFTTRLLRKRMSPSDRKEMDAKCGFTIDDEPSKHNQLPDPTSKYVAPPAGAGGATYSSADH
jgi:uncharacterized protein YegJ (DUF2314 family)